MDKKITTLLCSFFMLSILSQASYASFLSENNQVITFVVTDEESGLPVEGAAFDFKMCGQKPEHSNATGFLQVDVTGYSPDCMVSVSHTKYHTYQFKLKEAIAKNTLPIKLISKGVAYKGRISDGKNDIDLNGVTVKATNLKSKHIQKAYSNSSGIYTLYLHPNTSYLLDYSRYNYQSVKLKVDTGDGTDMGILGSQYIFPSSVGSTTTNSSPVSPPTATTTTPVPSAPSTNTVSAPVPQSPTTSTPTHPTSTRVTTVIPSSSGGIGFSVQLASLSKNNPNQPKKLNKIKGMVSRVYTKTDDTYKKFRVGVYRTKEEAEKVKKYLRAMGFKGAFTTVEDAKGLIQEVRL